MHIPQTAYTCIDLKLLTHMYVDWSSCGSVILGLSLVNSNFRVDCISNGPLRIRSWLDCGDAANLGCYSWGYYQQIGKPFVPYVKLEPDISYSSAQDNPITSEMCVSLARRWGFRYILLQWGQGCYGTSTPLLPESRVADSSCSLPCVGGYGICGASPASPALPVISVYDTGQCLLITHLPSHGCVQTDQLGHVAFIVTEDVWQLRQLTSRITLATLATKVGNSGTCDCTWRFCWPYMWCKDSTLGLAPHQVASVGGRLGFGSRHARQRHVTRRALG